LSWAILFDPTKLCPNCAQNYFGVARIDVVNAQDVLRAQGFQAHVRNAGLSGTDYLRPRCSIDFAKKIIMAMISEEDRPEFRGEAFCIEYL
jgi:hypothetical protein